MINNVTLLGRLTAAPELKTTQAGANYTSFTLAVDRSAPKDAARQTDFIDCIAWNKTAELISKYFGKGSLLALTGKLETALWKDSGGNSRKTTAVWVNTFSFANSKPRPSETESGSAGPPNGFAPPF